MSTAYRNSFRTGQQLNHDFLTLTFDISLGLLPLKDYQVREGVVTVTACLSDLVGKRRRDTFMKGDNLNYFDKAGPQRTSYLQQ